MSARTPPERTAATLNKMASGTLRGTADIATPAPVASRNKHLPLMVPMEDYYTAAGMFPSTMGDDPVAPEMEDGGYALVPGSGTYRIRSFTASHALQDNVGGAHFQLYQQSQPTMLALINCGDAPGWTGAVLASDEFTVSPADRAYVHSIGGGVEYSVVLATETRGPVVPLEFHPGVEPPSADSGFTARVTGPRPLVAGADPFNAHTWPNWLPWDATFREFRVKGIGRADLSTRISVVRLTGGVPVELAHIDAPQAAGSYDLTVSVGVSLPAGAEIEFRFILGSPGVSGTWAGFTPYLLTDQAPVGSTSGFTGAAWAALP